MNSQISMPGLAGKVVVITGATGGQGWAATQILLASGAIVIATDLAPELPESPGKTSSNLHYRQLDVTSEEQWSSVAQYASKLGPVHGLVNNAGIPFRARLGQMQLADWDRVLSINLTGPMLGMQAIAPLMSKGGSIVNIGSAAALTAHYTVSYTASKWGLRGLTHAAATEYGPLGIRVNIVHPGYIETPMVANAPAPFKAAQLALTPIERLGQPEDVAATVAFLLSDLASYISGAELPVDGAFTSSSGVKYISDQIRAGQ